MTTPPRKINPMQIPAIPPDLDPALKELLAALIYNMQLREGNVAKGTNTRFVTIQDLVDNGVVTDGAIK